MATQIKKVNAIEAVLFDLGNVLINVDFTRAIDYWSQFVSYIDEYALGEFLKGPHHLAYEKGQLTSMQFFKFLRNHLQADMNYDQLVLGWNQILVDEIEGISDLLQQCILQTPIYCFSNTNEIHYQCCQQQFSTLLSAFREIFVSYQLQQRKPELDAFISVIRNMRLQPNQILFFDDNEDNIDAASKLGIHAIKVQCIADMQNALDPILNNVNHCR